MKCDCFQSVNLFQQSLPVRGAWIEIQSVRTAVVPKQSLPVRGAWIEIA